LRYRRIEEGFFARFPERKPESPLFFSTPGRTELCGNHTDHNGGMVLAAAVNLDMAAAALPRTDRKVRIHSEGFGGFELDVGELSPRVEERASSQALVRGMAEGLSKLFGAGSAASERISGGGEAREIGAEQLEGGAVLRGFDAYVDSRVPLGSGLSSSAAFEVLIGSIFAVFAGIKVSPAELALIGRDAENRHFGKPSGLMDQTACAVGSLALIDFSDPGRAAINLLSFDPGRFGYNLAILGTGDSHADLTEDYASIPREMKAVAALLGKERLCGTTRSQLLSKAAEIRAACGDRAFLRAWHFAGETLRPQALAEAIASGDIDTYLGIVRASGDSSYKYLQNIYPEPRSFEASRKGPTDAEAFAASREGGARERGAIQGLAFALALTEDFLGGRGACRVHGGGFAGTIQAYIPADRAFEYQELAEKNFGAHSLYWIKIRRHGVVCIEHPLRSGR
jgi:galactokinase